MFLRFYGTCTITLYWTIFFWRQQLLLQPQHPLPLIVLQVSFFCHFQCFPCCCVELSVLCHHWVICHHWVLCFPCYFYFCHSCYCFWDWSCFYFYFYQTQYCLCYLSEVLLVVLCHHSPHDSYSWECCCCY